MNTKLIQRIIKEVIEEMSLPEMARFAGTGGAYKVTDKGKDILKQIKAEGNIPSDSGLNASKVAVLVWVYKAENEGKRVQKMDYAREKGVLQPSVNPLFNDLEMKGFISKEGYMPPTPKKEPGTTRPQPDIKSMFDDIDI
jgi:hypothetical protein